MAGIAGRALGQAWLWVPAVVAASLLSAAATIGTDRIVLAPASTPWPLPVLLLVAAIPPLIGSQIEGRMLLWLLRRHADNPAPPADHQA